MLYYSLFDRGLDVLTEENNNVKERTRQRQAALLVEGNKWAFDSNGGLEYYSHRFNRPECQKNG